MNTNEKRDHVVSLTDLDTGEEGFLYHDPDCGYLMKSTFLGRSSFFTLEEAEQRMKELMAEKESVYTSGEKFPPDFISRGLGMSYAKMKAHGNLCIKRIDLVTVGIPIEVKGEIKKPTGFKYD